LVSNCQNKSITPNFGGKAMSETRTVKKEGKNGTGDFHPGRVGFC